MALAQQHGTGRIRLNLTAQDVNKIKQYLAGMQSKLNVNKMSILFDNIKSVFGERIFEGLLNFPLQSREAFSMNSTSDHWVHKSSTFSVSDCTVSHGSEGAYVEDITIHFAKALSIMHVFDKNQQQFLGKMGLQKFSIFRIKRSSNSSQFGYEILPFCKSWRAGGSMFMFGFSASTKAIEMVPISMDFRKEPSINTSHIPLSVERLWLFAKDELMSSDSNVFKLILDHDRKSRLNTIIVASDTNKRFVVDIKCNVQLSAQFNIENISSQCQIVGYKKMKVTDTQDMWRSLLQQMQDEEDSDEYY